MKLFALRGKAKPFFCIGGLSVSKSPRKETEKNDVFRSKKKGNTSAVKDLGRGAIIVQNPLLHAFVDMHSILSKKGRSTQNSPEKTKLWLSDIRQYLTSHMGTLFSNAKFYYATNSEKSSGMPFYSLLIEPHKIELVETVGGNSKKGEFSLQTDQIFIDKQNASSEESGFFLKKLAFIAQDIATYKIPIFAERPIGGKR